MWFAPSTAKSTARFLLRLLTLSRTARNSKRGRTRSNLDVCTVFARNFHVEIPPCWSSILLLFLARRTRNGNVSHRVVKPPLPPPPIRPSPTRIRPHHRAVNQALAQALDLHRRLQVDPVQVPPVHQPPPLLEGLLQPRVMCRADLALPKL